MNHRMKYSLDSFILSYFFRGNNEYSSELQSDAEVELEPPLPLRSDDELQHCGPFLPPHHCMHNHGKDKNGSKMFPFRVILQQIIGLLLLMHKKSICF